MEPTENTRELLYKSLTTTAHKLFEGDDKGMIDSALKAFRDELEDKEVYADILEWRAIKKTYERLRDVIEKEEYTKNILNPETKFEISHYNDVGKINFFGRRGSHKGRMQFVLKKPGEQDRDYSIDIVRSYDNSNENMYVLRLCRDYMDTDDHIVRRHIQKDISGHTLLMFIVSLLSEADKVRPPELWKRISPNEQKKDDFSFVEDF